MDEYIEREATCGDCIHADVCEEVETLVGFSRENKAYCGMFLNSADVAPVRHGRWKRRGKNLGECSECGEVVAVRHRYCHNCGAVMDVRMEEDNG